MNDRFRERRQGIRLMPGESYTSQSGVVMSTLLGSCVSACIYDPVNRVAGMNHFLLSNDRYSKKFHFSHTEAGRYGIQAMELLINSILKLGGQKRLLQAKAFGGGQVLDIGPGSTNFLCVGEVNVSFIKSYLETEGIPLCASALGGEFGRIIRFHTLDFSVDVKNISQRLHREVDERDATHWAKRLEAQQAQKLDVEFF